MNRFFYLKFNLIGHNNNILRLQNGETLGQFISDRSDF